MCMSFKQYVDMKYPDGLIVVSLTQATTLCDAFLVPYN